MTSQDEKTAILRTKLHRPPVPINYVHRPGLIKHLEKDPRRPLVLISAPAGYGKSTLASCWLKDCKRPSAWLSLDENDNDLRRFLSYFIAAIHAIQPKAVRRVQSFLEAPNLLPIPELATSIVNDLERIGRNFILVLDDIHLIREKAIHSLIDLLLRHPSRSMQLVLIGRRDPNVRVGSLRAKGLLTEVRMRDLLFTVDEGAQFLQSTIGPEVEKSTAAAVVKKTEGWVTGLRLLSIAMRGKRDLARKFLKMSGTTHYMIDYLISEVLAQQKPDISQIMLKTAILDRFCAALCQALMEDDGNSINIQNDAGHFIDHLRKENLFLITLDTEGQWFRYHHLFQDLLKRELRLNHPKDEIANLHLRASKWFESQGLITEAIEHALLAGKTSLAADIVEGHRHNEFDADRWYVVEQWLAMLPAKIKRQRPSLLMTDGWVAYCRLQLERVPALIQQCEAAVGDGTLETEQAGELEFFRGSTAYWAGEAKNSRRHLEEALSRFGYKKRYVESETELALGLARFMTGDKELAITALEDRIRGAGTQKGVYLAKLIGALVLIHLLSGDLVHALAQAKRFRRVAAMNRLQNHKAWSDYFEGLIHLQTNELDKASRHFSRAIKRRYIFETRAVLDAFSGLALTQQLMQQSDNAQDTEDRLQRFANELNDPTALAVADSCAARLSALRGNPSTAESYTWSPTGELAVESMFMWLEAPLITQARCFIIEGSKQSLKAATESLRDLELRCKEWRFTCQAVEIAVLQCLALQKQGRENEALDALKEALSLAEPGQWIRPFVEAGAPMSAMLIQLRKRHNIFEDYTAKLLAALKSNGPVSAPPAPKPKPPSPRAASPQPLVEPLTNREVDVLELLAQRLQNKEIAEKLVVSPKTVKSHLRNIYQKLGVSSRREAVEKASVLDLLP